MTDELEIFEERQKPKKSRLILGIAIGMILMLVLQAVGIFILYKTISHGDGLGGGGAMNLASMPLLGLASFFMSSPMTPQGITVMNYTHNNTPPMEIEEGRNE